MTVMLQPSAAKQLLDVDRLSSKDEMEGDDRKRQFGLRTDIYAKKALNVYI